MISRLSAGRCSIGRRKIGRLKIVFNYKKFISIPLFAHSKIRTLSKNIRTLLSMFYKNFQAVVVQQGILPCVLHVNRYQRRNVFETFIFSNTYNINTLQNTVIVCRFFDKGSHLKFWCQLHSCLSQLMSIKP